MTRIATLLAAGISVLAFSAAANAADLIISEPAAPGYVDVSGNWDGAYVGAFVGAGWGTFDWGPTEDVSGWLVGGTIGANFTVSSGIVAGVVADLAWADLNEDSDTFNVDWQGSVRGRLGFDGGAFLPYLTAGLAVAGAEIDGDDQTHVGWTAGAGVEFAITDDLSIDALYRYSDYGTETYAGPGDTSLTSSTFQVGLNWRF